MVPVGVEPCENAQVPPRGVEQDQKSSGKTPLSQSDGAESGAVGAPDRPTDPDLQHLITAWPDLPDAVRAGITAMVQATAR